MIQVYSQEKRMEKVPASQYYLSKDTYQASISRLRKKSMRSLMFSSVCTAHVQLRDDSYAVDQPHLAHPTGGAGTDPVRGFRIQRRGKLR